MAWAVEGCLKWQQEGLELPDCVNEAIKEYKSEMDILATFCENCVQIDYETTEKILASNLFAIYSIWAKENNEFEMSSRKFFIEIGKKLPEKIRAGDGIYYPKIHLNDYAKKLYYGGINKQYKFDDFK